MANVDPSGHQTLAQLGAVGLLSAILDSIILTTGALVFAYIYDHAAAFHTSTSITVPTVTVHATEDAQEIADTIANGHSGTTTADGGHLEEFEDLMIYDPESLSDFIKDVLEAAGTEIKHLSGDRTGYFDADSGTIIVVNPNDPDGGTAYRPAKDDPPRDPRATFDNLK